MGSLPKCFYPTEVVFIDNSEIYLQTLELFFGSNPYPTVFKTFSDPEQALCYINNKKKAPPQTFWEPEDTFSSNSYAFKLNVFSLHKKIYDSNRFKQISVVIADYDLGPNCINGVELCNRIPNKHLQKILFTGQTKHDFVIKAFNERKIQHYVPKQTITSLEDVLELIKQMQEKYFLNLTESLQVALTTKPKFPLAIYSSAFQTYFRHLIKTNDIEEYYLLDAVGSFLLIDHQHKAHILVVQNEDQCQANYLELKDEVDEQTQIKLKNREIMLYDPHFWDDKIQNQKKCFLTPERIEDRELRTSFFCCLTNDQELINLKKATFFKRKK